MNETYRNKFRTLLEVGWSADKAAVICQELLRKGELTDDRVVDALDYKFEDGRVVTGIDDMERNKTMKLRNAAIIMNDYWTTVGVRFEGSSTDYTFICEKELARNLQIDDKVVCCANKGCFAIVTVTRIDEESEIFLEDNLNFNFVFQKVAVEKFDTLNQQLEASEQQLKREQRLRLREEVKNKLAIEFGSQHVLENDTSQS